MTGKKSTQDLCPRLRELVAGRAGGPADGTAPLPGTRDQEAERLVAIIEALVSGEDAVELAVNLPNEGKIPNLPREAVVEVPAVVGADRITGDDAVGAHAPLLDRFTGPTTEGEGA